MGSFKPMVKMKTTEPTVELKLKSGGFVHMKKGGTVKMADGGGAMEALMGTPALLGRPAVNAPVRTPGKPPMAARRKAMMAKKRPPMMEAPPIPPPMKHGGNASKKALAAGGKVDSPAATPKVEFPPGQDMRNVSPGDVADAKVRAKSTAAFDAANKTPARPAAK